MGWPDYTGDASFIPVTRNPRTPQVADEYGNPTIYGTTDNANATFPIDERIVEFQQYGVLNGTFARGPADPNHDITDINPLPDWTGPVGVSGGAITAQWVADASSPSGYVLRFIVNAGAASDEVYLEQIVPVGGEYGQAIGHRFRAYVPSALVSGVQAKCQLQYLDVNGNAVGAATTSASASGPLQFNFSANAASGGGPPSTARSLRIRIGCVRTGAASSTDTVDFSSCRLDKSAATVLLADRSVAATYAPAQLFQTNGEVLLSPDGGSGPIFRVSVSDTVSSARLSGSGALRLDGGIVNVAEGSAPATPPIGFHSIYAKSADSKLYSKDDSGNEYPLNLLGTSGTAGGDLTGNYPNPTIAAAAVTLAKMANLAANSILGNNTGSPATPIALTAAQVRTFLALVIGTNVQAWDADLDTLAAATVATGQTFTPALAYATVGSSTWATTTAVGFYTRLLDRIIFNFTYQGVPTNGTAAGNLQLSGLPVTVQNTAGSSSHFAVSFQGYTKANFTWVVGAPVINTTTATFLASGSAQTRTALAVADIPTGGTVIVQGGGHYLL